MKQMKDIIIYLLCTFVGSLIAITYITWCILNLDPSDIWPVPLTFGGAALLLGDIRRGDVNA